MQICVVVNADKKNSLSYSWVLFHTVLRDKEQYKSSPLRVLQWPNTRLLAYFSFLHCFSCKKQAEAKHELLCFVSEISCCTYMYRNEK